MTRIVLTGGAYTARSIIAAAQRCVNLFAEPVPNTEPAQAVHYPTPGLVTVATASGPVRGLWWASNGELFAAIGETLYFVDAAYSLTALGPVPGGNPVGMADNAVTLVVVNGTGGWTVDLASHAFAQITDAAFYGADTVGYVDTYFVFNKPGTQQFYISDSNATTFDPLYFAGKVGQSDLLQTLVVCRREIWLIGAVSTEVWFDSGAADFPFQVVPGAFIEQGTCAKYSAQRLGESVFWLTQNRAGERYVVRGKNYQAQRVSTFAIEAEIAGYSRVDDAIGWTYQQAGHAFYVLTFPTANKTWAFDISTGEWSERVYTDADGNENRHRAQCAANAYDGVIVGDWENGKLYLLDPDTYTDDGNQIVRVRGFPHMVQDGDRVMYRQFIANMEVGRVEDASDPLVSLRWSDTRGASWGNPVLLSAGKTGDFYQSMQAQRLGMARDRVFELSWSAPFKTALIGAYVESKKAGT